MEKLNLSHNACYACTHVAVPLSFNSLRHYLGFTSQAYNDVNRIKYSFYEHKGLYWYSVTLLDGLVMNSLFFVGLANCVRDFRCLCETMCWDLEDSSGLSYFVAWFNKKNQEGGR